MQLNHDTPIDQIRELANIHAPSDHDVTWEQASRLKRALLAGGWSDSDHVDTINLILLTREAITIQAAVDDEGFYIRPEPIGEPERDRGCYEMPLGVPRG